MNPPGYYKIDIIAFYNYTTSKQVIQAAKNENQ